MDKNTLKGRLSHEYSNEYLESLTHGELKALIPDFEQTINEAKQLNIHQKDILDRVIIFTQSNIVNRLDILHSNDFEDFREEFSSIKILSEILRIAKNLRSGA